MLKVKDNVDLKELEKYGFKKTKFNSYIIDFGSNHYESNFINISTKDRVIDVVTAYFGHKEISILYNLIKADLIEKVDDK